MAFGRLGKRDIMKLGASVKRGAASSVTPPAGGGETGQPVGLLLLITKA